MDVNSPSPFQQTQPPISLPFAGTDEKIASLALHLEDALTLSMFLSLLGCPGKHCQALERMRVVPVND
jgi:hypothetical protein